MKKWKILAIALSVMALPLAASAAGFEFAVGGWYVQPSGQIALNTNGGPNDFINFNRMGIDDEWQIMFRSKIQPPMLPGIYLQATPMSWGSNNRGSASDLEFSFGDAVFFAGDKIDSDFFLNEYDAALYIPIPLLKQGTLGVVNVEFGAGARWITMRSSLTNVTALEDVNEVLDTNALEDTQRASVVYPVGYAALIVRPIERLSLEGEIWGWSWNSDKFYTLNARLKLLLLGPLYLSGGYRDDYYHFSQDDLIIRNAHFKGPYGEIGLQF
jgi:outer membrane protein